MSDSEDSVSINSEDGCSIASLACSDPAKGQSGAFTQATLLDSGRATRRDPFRAIVLLLGTSGHGKSTTINRLIGHNLLKIGRSELQGSTTKDIERVNIFVPGHHSSPSLTLSFDDTPGTDDTTNEDRATNSSLLRIYSNRYFPTKDGRRVYPNIILLIAAWASINEDAHNAPHQFTSALGKSMNQLHDSGLVDHERPNVIVVVTKSLSDWSQFDDLKTEREKDARWVTEADGRRRIITAIQRRLFPRLRPWKVVFIENQDNSFTDDGIDRGVRRHKFPVLPNRETSHQNLFDAMRDLIIEPSNGMLDITGLHALRVVSGAKRLKTKSLPPPEILVHKSDAQSDILPPSNAPSHPNRTSELVESYLGVTFNAITGDFGRTRVLKLKPQSIKTFGADSQLEDFRRLSSSTGAKVDKSTHIGGEVDVHAVAGAGFHYAGGSNSLSLHSDDDEVYDSRIVTKKVYIGDLTPRLTPEFLDIIKELPRWSIRSPEPHRNFFSMYGTHVILRMAIGGHVRVVVHDHHDIGHAGQQREGGVHMSVPGLQAAGVTATATGTYHRDSGSERARAREHFTIHRSGGARMAAQLSDVLGKHFANVDRGVNSCPWPVSAVRTKWMKALQDDPEFLKDDKTTEYKPLWGLSDLNAQQKEDLHAAFNYLYFQSTAKSIEGPLQPPPYSGPKEVEMSRAKNKKSISRTIKDFFSKAFKRSGESK
ncbi:hypothetical protein B0H16DRAFT_1775621 [Mycena metata]|uniref:MACPF domain-containing protein n=1 Tax=Mycena metata TaxID=1033252 RepID=A0AAD7MRR3_9AGAR|nr:hypothetical protein B0H16DRAFT_1775621 [Mycena metata]